MERAAAASRLPVGSSATIIGASFARARAMATLCFWPPESWLVRQNDVRACEHGAGERNSLTFAAAELRRMPLFQPRKSEARNERRKAGGIRAAVVEANRKRDVLGNRERIDEIETLEYDSDVAAAEARRFAVAHFRDFGASDAYGAGIRGDESRKDVEKSRFPGP